MPVEEHERLVQVELQRAQETQEQLILRIQEEYLAEFQRLE